MTSQSSEGGESEQRDSSGAKAGSTREIAKPKGRGRLGSFDDGFSATQLKDADEDATKAKFCIASPKVEAKGLNTVETTPELQGFNLGAGSVSL